MEKKFQPPGESQTKKRFKDEQTDKRNHEHLTNENDTISEEDISNVKTDISLFNENHHLSVIPGESDPSEDEPGLTPEEEKVKDNSDPDIETSWNILGS